MIQDMLDMAVIAAENYIGLVLQDSSWKMTIYDALPSRIKFIHAPVLKIEQIKLFNGNDEISYLSKDNYIFDQRAEALLIKKHYSIKKCEITYRVGYKELPAPIRQGILEHLVKLYDVRGGDQALPTSAKSLYQAYKRVRL
jgi:uncharacterized phiE125 gp8 family phage protein